MLGKKQVVCPQRAMRLMGVVITGGTPALSGICSNNMTLTRNGTGDYTLTFAIAFKQAPQVLATPVTSGIMCSISSVSTTAVRILTKNTSAAATQATLHVLVIGSDTVDQI